MFSGFGFGFSCADYMAVLIPGNYFRFPVTVRRSVSRYWQQQQHSGAERSEACIATRIAYSLDTECGR